MNIQLYFVISRGFLKLDGGRCQRNLRKTSKKKKNAHPSSSVSNSEWVFHCGQVTQEEVLVVVTSSSTHVECILRMVWNGGMKEIQDTRLPTQLPLSWLQISFLSPENQKKSDELRFWQGFQMTKRTRKRFDSSSNLIKFDPILDRTHLTQPNPSIIHSPHWDFLSTPLLPKLHVQSRRTMLWCQNVRLGPLAKCPDGFGSLQAPIRVPIWQSNCDMTRKNRWHKRMDYRTCYD